MSASKMKVSMSRARGAKVTPYKEAKPAAGISRTVAKRNKTSNKNTFEHESNTANVSESNKLQKIKSKHENGFKQKSDSEILSKGISERITSGGEKEHFESKAPSKTCGESDKEIRKVILANRNGTTRLMRKSNCNKPMSEIPMCTVKECKVNNNSSDRTSTEHSKLSHVEKDGENAMTALPAMRGEVSQKKEDSVKENDALKNSLSECETESNISFLKAEPVISDSCVPTQTTSVLSGVSEHSCNALNTPGNTSLTSSVKCDTDQNEVISDALEHVSDGVNTVGCNNEITTVESNELTLKKETSNNSSTVCKSVPSYLRTTLSSSNKDSKSISKASKSQLTKTSRLSHDISIKKVSSKTHHINSASETVVKSLPHQDDSVISKTATQTCDKRMANSYKRKGKSLSPEVQSPSSTIRKTDSSALKNKSPLAHKQLMQRDRKFHLLSTRQGNNIEILSQSAESPHKQKQAINNNGSAGNITCTLKSSETKVSDPVEKPSILSIKREAQQKKTTSSCKSAPILSKQQKSGRDVRSRSMTPEASKAQCNSQNNDKSESNVQSVSHIEKSNIFSSNKVQNRNIRLSADKPKKVNSASSLRKSMTNANIESNDRISATDKQSKSNSIKNEVTQSDIGSIKMLSLKNKANNTTKSTSTDNTVKLNNDKDLSMSDDKGRDSSSRSRSTTPGSISTSSSGSLSSKKSSMRKSVPSTLKRETSNVTKMNNRVSTSRSRSSTPGVVSSVTDSTGKSSMKENTEKESKCTQKTNSVPRSRLTKPGSLSLTRRSITDNSTKQTTIKVQTKDSLQSNLSLMSRTTQCAASGRKISMCKQTENKLTHKIDRDSKSRSRSTTPGSSASSPSGESTGKLILKQTSNSSNKLKSQTKVKSTTLKNITPRTSLKTSNISRKIDDKVTVLKQNSPIQNDSSVKTPSTTKTDKVVSSEASTDEQEKNQVKTNSNICRGNSLEKQSRSSTPSSTVNNAKCSPGRSNHLNAATQRSNVTKERTLKNNANNNHHSKIGVQTKISNNIQTKPTGVSNKLKKSNIGASSDTPSNSQRESSQSSLSLSATAGNSGRKNAENKPLSLSKRGNTCSNKKQMISTELRDKRALRSTELSIKPDSRKSAGIMSEKNKSSDSVQTSVESRNNSKIKTIHNEKKANKTFVNDNKSKSASVSVIKESDFSTASCNKSERAKLSKQKGQDTKSLCSSKEIHTVSLSSDANELISLGNDGFIASRASISDENIQRIIENDTSKIVTSDKGILSDTKIHLGNIRYIGLTEESLCQNENDRNDKNEHKQHISEGALFPPNARRMDINSTDPEENVRDPKSEVRRNCLLDRTINEQSRVNEGGFQDQSCQENGNNNNRNMGIHVGHDTNNSSKSLDKMDIVDLNNENVELFCENCTGTNNEQCYSEPCLCTNLIDKRIKCTCTCKCSHGDGASDKYQYKLTDNNKNEEDLAFLNSQNLKCQNDRCVEKQTFDIDTCDVNSSHQVPITDVSSFKYTDFTDSQKDKTKCTETAPVTGAASIQIQNKRLDKKAVSSLTCGFCERELSSTRNGFVRTVHEDDASKSDRDNNMNQIMQNTDDGLRSVDVNTTCSDTGISTCDMCKDKVLLRDSKYCKDSCAFEHELSDWQTIELCDRICSQTMAEIQVINKSEQNKGASEPENVYKKVNGDDVSEILNCEKMDGIHTENGLNSDPYRVSSHPLECEILLDSDAQKLTERSVPTDNTFIETISSVYGKQKQSALNSKSVSDSQSGSMLQNASENRDITFLQDGNSDMLISGTELKSSSEYINDCLIGDHQQNQLTFEVQNEENICSLDEGNILPERTSRAEDAKLITKEHDLPSLANCACTNTCTTVCESGQTGKQKNSHSESCDLKQCKNDSSPMEDINCTPPRESFSQTQLLRFKPEGPLLQREDKSFTTGTPCIPELQEKQTDCLDYANDFKSLFSQHPITEDGLAISKCSYVSNFTEFNNHSETNTQRQRHCSCSTENRNDLNDDQQISSAQQMTNFISGMQHDEKCVLTKPNLQFSEVPQLSKCIYKKYPHLISRNASCNKIISEKEINHENMQCSKMTQTANINKSSLSMKQNDRACLLPHYKQSGENDTIASHEYEHCAGLLQVSEGISTDNLKKLQTQYDLIGIQTKEQTSFKNTENNLCSDSMPCDGSKVQISAVINRKNSPEYLKLNDLSRTFDDHEDNTSCGIMSRDPARAQEEGAELSSEFSTDLTGCKTVKNYNRNSYQDVFQDKTVCLSTLKSTTQENSCNLMFSEKFSGAQDFMPRYGSKNSSGQKKFYSCEDEHDTCIASSQDENNFKNLAANRDGDINYEIKSNRLNIETPTPCDSSSEEYSKINCANQGQCSATVQADCLTGESEHFESGELLNKYSCSDKRENWHLPEYSDSAEQKVSSSTNDDVLNRDNTFSSLVPDHTADKQIGDNRNIENGCVLRSFVNTVERQTEADLNNKGSLNIKEFNSSLSLPCTESVNTPGIIKGESINENLSYSSDSLQIGSVKAYLSEQSLDLRDTKKQNDGIKSTLNIGQLHQCLNHADFDLLRKRNLDALNSTGKLSTEVQSSSVQSHSSVYLPLDESLSDNSEIYTDAEDRVSSPYLDNDCLGNLEHSTSSVSNISYRDSTSTESFADAVESLDDEYLTTVKSRHSKEFHNEEDLSQSTSESAESTTSVIGSMEDLSGWEEFSENITDIRCYNGEMEPSKYDVTSDTRNRFRNLPDCKTHVPVYQTGHSLKDNTFQKPSPILESYPSVIKTNTLRYKDMRNDAKQEAIRNSNFETGNGGTLKGTTDAGHTNKASFGSSAELQVAGCRLENMDGNHASLDDSTSEITPLDMQNNTECKSNDNTTQSVVGSKIETAVLKRTERRRRRQLFEQQKNNIDFHTTQNSCEITHAPCETIKSEPSCHDEICNKESIDQKSNSKHFTNSCTVSDNVILNIQHPAVEQALPEPEDTKWNEYVIHKNAESRASINVCNENCDQKTTMGKHIDNEGANGHNLYTENELSEENRTTLEEKTLELESSFVTNVQTKTDERKQCLSTYKTKPQSQNIDTEFDDIEFIDADDITNEGDQTKHVDSGDSYQVNLSEVQQRKSESPNASFTFTYEEDSDESILLNDSVNTTVIENTVSPVINIAEEPIDHAIIENKVSTVINDAEECIYQQENTTFTNSQEPTDHAIVDTKGSSENEAVKENTDAQRQSESDDYKSCNDFKKESMKCEVDHVSVMSNAGQKADHSKNISSDIIKQNEDIEISDVNITEQRVDDDECTDSDICEESNISVKLALELEKKKLAQVTDTRSRKGIFVNKRNERRATIDNCSFEDESNKNNDNEKNVKSQKENVTLKKSQSFRTERKQISPVPSFMNFPQVANEEKSEQQTELENKKVSDICRSFMTKTKASALKSRTQSTSKSPAPNRKLMKWVNNHGKWMRIPVDETHETKSESHEEKPSTDSHPQLQETSNLITDSNVELDKAKQKQNQNVSKEFRETSKAMAKSTVVEEQHKPILTVINTGEQGNTGDTSDIHEQPKVLNNIDSGLTQKHGEKSKVIHPKCEHTVCDDKNESNYPVETTTLIESEIEYSPVSTADVHQATDKCSTLEPFKPVLHNTKLEQAKLPMTSKDSDLMSNQSSCNDKNIANTDIVPTLERQVIEGEKALDIKEVGLTLNDAQCDQEKHLKRQELLFGLLNSYYRRKPKRFSQHDQVCDRTKHLASSKNDKEKVNKQCDEIKSKQIADEASENTEFITESPRTIPKIKCVKIQEEVFECKKEYLKESNFPPLPYSDDIRPNLTLPRVRTDEKGTDKTIKQIIKKSKTFSGFGDIERQKNVIREYAALSVQTDRVNTRPVDINNTVNDQAYSTPISPSKLVDKRAKAGLKLNLEKARNESGNKVNSDLSPCRPTTEKPRGRPQTDRSPSRLCVEQPRMRVRSPEKGPRQIHRSQLLSEIVEVEENKDDNSVTYDRRYPQRQYREVQKPVNKRSNKRRSLSLPTGTLAFGDARIVYKNGHFTIETMDTTEFESSHHEDYRSSFGHLDAADDEVWDEPEEGVHSRSGEAINMHNKPLMRRQNAKTVLKSSDSTEDVFFNDSDIAENSRYRSDLNSEPKVLNMGRADEEMFNESCSSRTSDMSVDSYSSDRTDISAEDSLTDAKKLSSSSLPERKDEDVKHVIQRAKRTSSFRAAQEGGSLRLSGIEEDQVHNSSRARSVSLDESPNTDLKNSPKVQSVQNQNPTFLKKVMAKRKNANENISGFTKQSESAREFFVKKMTLKGLFKKNKSDTSMNSPLKTEHPVSPPLATFQDDDIGSVDTPPSSPYKPRDLRRRHTSADILRTYPDSKENDSNCPTPTQERSSVSRSSISTPSTPSHESSVFLNLSSQSAPQFRDEDEMSITSASSFASSIHSPPMEQPHKPKTPKPIGASPRRNSSVGSQLSRTGSQSSQRNVLYSVTSLESDQYESLKENMSPDMRCECDYETRNRNKTSIRNVRGSAGSLAVCQFCRQREFYRSDRTYSSSSLHKQQSREKLSDESSKLPCDSSARNYNDRLGIISQTDVASSNSNDSGIQRDASLHSSNESIKGTPENRVRLRRNKSLSPHADRPKSEIAVKWADGDSGDYDITETSVKLRNKNLRDRPRPKSDLEDNIHLFDELFEEVLEDFETDGSSFLSGRMKAFGSDVNLQPYCSLRSLYEVRRHDLDRQKNRRMSTPHPIKSRLQRAPHKLQKQPPLVRSSSMPESLEKIHKPKKMHHLLDFHLDSVSRHMDIDDLSEGSDFSFDQASLQERGSISVQSSTSQLTGMDEDEENLTYAEALWDHITMDPEELAFRAGDVIEVLDMADKDWWFGVIDDMEGWFPATFVRIRVNQDELDDDLDLDTTLQDNLMTSPKLRRISMFNKNQARTNVVNEIINAEREYVKHLKDVVEGYIQHARKRTEMFPEERILLIFGNIETIYSFAKKFLSQLEMCIDVFPHLSEIGQCFLDNDRGFEIYSDYCNNHPSACEELDELCKDSKYKHFFEACRLLQELVEIPLEGFLLTPVQKICKYPLQLAELLKYTPPDHADYMMVKDALAAMRKIATLINERKRKMESIEKIAVWQQSVVDWEGPDLLERSSELIFSGELNKINTAGWSQERFFFLFDHQLVYCKKELLKRHVFSYKGRIDLDHCDIVDIPDGKDAQYNVTVKHAWKFHETHKDKWYLVYAKSEAVKQHWLKALKNERHRVIEDQQNDFCVPDHWKQTVLNKVRSQSNMKDKHSGGRTSHGQLSLQKDLKDFTYATLPRHRGTQKHDKKKGWFKFGGGKKSKR